jgi:anti-sigma factor RsiW
MTCNEFEELGLGAERDTPLSEAQHAALASHGASCARCAALRDSWEATRVELRSLAQATNSLDAPARVEMRLRQQFRTQYQTPRVRRIATVAAWGLAAAAMLVGAVSWVKWHSNQQSPVAHKPNTPASNQGSADQNASGDSPTLVADNELGDFTLLPGVLPAETDGSAILNVRMQRGALGGLGLPVNEDRAAEWIQVDLLVGNDGLPQAVRLPE